MHCTIALRIFPVLRVKPERMKKKKSRGGEGVQSFKLYLRDPTYSNEGNRGDIGFFLLYVINIIV